MKQPDIEEHQRQARSKAQIEATAPKLLEALKELVEELQTFMRGEECDHDVGICICTTRNRIFKAKHVISEAEKEVKP